MARARNIKPGFFRNADLVELSFETRLLFIGLWTLADRSGRLEDRPKQIKMELFPADSVDCDGMLAELEQIGCIDRYEVGGRRFIQVVNFDKHQNPHRDEKASAIPDRDGKLAEQPAKPAKHSASTVQAPCEDDANPVPIRLIPDSLIPDSPTECTHTPLAEGWKLPKPWGEWAIAEFPHWTAEVVRSIADQFADHWRASAGSSADWQATWQKWCRDDLTQRAHPKPREAAQPRASPITVAVGPLRNETEAQKARDAAHAEKLADPEEKARVAAAIEQARQRMAQRKAA